jgi:hypothetical protein
MIRALRADVAECRRICGALDEGALGLLLLLGGADWRRRRPLGASSASA